MSDIKHDRIDKILIVLVIIINLFMAGVSLLWLFTDAFMAVKNTLKEENFLGLNEKVTYGLFLSGVLGGSFYCLRRMYQRLGEAYTPIEGCSPQPAKVLNIKVWLFWYVFRPLQGGILALIVLCLVNSKLLIGQDLNDKSLSTFFTQVAIGFLAGFGSHELIHKIEEIIKVLFAKSKSTGSTSQDKVRENRGDQ